MGEAAVQLKLAGHTYQVVTSAAEEDLTRLALRVEEALYAVTPDGRQPSQQAIVLAAITLAHELEEERRELQELKAKYQGTLTALLGEVDTLLGNTPARLNAVAPIISSTASDDPFGDSARAADSQVPARIPARRERPGERGELG